MSDEEIKGTVGKVARWLAILSTALTIILTALNAYRSQQVSKVDTGIKVKAAELERQRLELDAGKERLARYTFVQNLLAGVLTQDYAQKNLTINLITLALAETEAQQLFAGLQASDNQATRNVGTLGSDVVALSSLVLQMNDAVKENRIGAVQRLIDNYRGNSTAVEQAVSLLEKPKLDTLSASGRINVLVYLRNTDAVAWTPQTFSRAEKAISDIRSKGDTGNVIGPQTDDALKQLSSHITKLRGH
jgi:hypothetical protein